MNTDFDPDFDRMSHAVERVEMYRMDGMLFTSHSAAIEHRENMIEERLRPVLNRYNTGSAADQISLISWIMSNRKDLRELLDY